MSLFRKVMKLFKIISCAKDTLDRLTSGKGLTFEVILKCLADLINSIDYLADHILLLHKLNMMTFSKKIVKQCDFISDFCKLLDIITNTFIKLPKFIEISNEINKLLAESSKSDGSKIGVETINNQEKYYY